MSRLDSNIHLDPGFSNTNGRLKHWIVLQVRHWQSWLTLSKWPCLSGTFGAYNDALHSKHHYRIKPGTALVTLWTLVDPGPGLMATCTPLTRLVHMKYLAVVTGLVLWFYWARPASIFRLSFVIPHPAEIVSPPTLQTIFISRHITQHKSFMVATRLLWLGENYLKFPSVRRHT